MGTDLTWQVLGVSDGDSGGFALQGSDGGLDEMINVSTCSTTESVRRSSPW